MKVCLACEARFASVDWRCPECGKSPAGDGYLRFATAPGRAEDAFPEESFGHLPVQEERSFWFRARNDLIDWALRSYFSDAASFFELGCGTGVILAALR